MLKKTISGIKERFRKKTFEDIIYKISSKKVYIRNGIGHGFISDEHLYDNSLLEIGFGQVCSGYGDWGNGSSQATKSAVKITINNKFIITNIEFESFYNSDESEEIKNSLEKNIKLKVNDELVLQDEQLKLHLEEIFKLLPCKNHIGWDCYDSPHMYDYFVKNGWRAVSDVRDPLWVSEQKRYLILPGIERFVNLCKHVRDYKDRYFGDKFCQKCKYFIDSDGKTIGCLNFGKDNSLE